MKRFTDQLTPATTEQVFVALYSAWLEMVKFPPSRDSVILLIAHWALETGWGKYMHCHNLGNIKSRLDDGRDHCYFVCGEEVLLSTAQRWVTESPECVSIVRTYALKSGDKLITMASVTVRPDHPACRFRAYETLQSGAVDYLRLLREKFDQAWPFVELCDPIGFVRALKQQRYFTAAEEPYAKAVTSIVDKLKKTLDVDTEALPVLTDAEKRDVVNRIAVSLVEMDLQLHSGTHAGDEDE